MTKVAAAVRKVFGATELGSRLADVEAQIIAKESEQAAAVLADEAGEDGAGVKREQFAHELKKLRELAAELRGASALAAERAADTARAARIKAAREAEQALAREVGRLADQCDAWDRAVDALVAIRSEIQETQQRVIVMSGTWAGLAKGVGSDTKMEVLLGAMREATKHFWPSLGYKLRAFAGVRSGIYVNPEAAQMGPRFRSIPAPKAHAEG